MVMEKKNLSEACSPLKAAVTKNKEYTKLLLQNNIYNNKMGPHLMTTARPIAG